MRIEAYGRFSDGRGMPLWHVIVDVNVLRTACGFRFDEATSEIRPHVAPYDDVCGVCEDAVAEPQDTASATTSNAQWRPSDHA